MFEPSDSTGNRLQILVKFSKSSNNSTKKQEKELIKSGPTNKAAWKTMFLTIHRTHILWFSVLGDEKGLRSAAIRTSCLRPLPIFTPRTDASVVFRSLEPGVRPSLAADLGVCLGVGARRGVRRGVQDDAPAISVSRPGVATKQSSRENSLVLWNFWANKTETLTSMASG